MDTFNVFRKGSTTYSTSSLFFPVEKRQDVASLYAFVRVADDFVDSIPQDAKSFLAFKDDYFAARSTYQTIIDFKRIAKQYNFESQWTQAFFASMEMDLHRSSYQTLRDLETYLYGSAEVIGLYMSRILGISSTADTYARLLGKAMQLINFIRDIDEDIDLGRVYFPQEDVQKFGISSSDYLYKRVAKSSMVRLIRFEIERYFQWQKEAERGYEYIPKRYRIAVKTAGDMYIWVARNIYKNPLIVFERKVKPSKWLILIRGLSNLLFS